MRFLKKTMVGESGQPAEFHAITSLAVDREAGIATIVLTSWVDLHSVGAAGAATDEQEHAIHIGAWTPELAFQMLDLVATLPQWAGAEILDQD